MPELSSTERKRLRDRRAQQNSRDKKLRRVTELEQRVAHCELYHEDRGVERLLEVITGLREQNQTLIARQNDLKTLVNSWPDIQNTPSTENPWLCSEEHLRSNESHMSYSERADIESPSGRSSGSVSNLERSLALATKDDLAWKQLPLYCDEFSDIRNVSLPWLAYPEQIAGCPVTLSSPLDILYGSKTNYLANAIHLVLERRPLREPEKLAMGWVTYHFTQWIISPSPESFGRVPSFLRPIQDQLQISHPIALSCIPWPKIRSNFIRQWHFYEDNREMLFGMFACCTKIRWPWGEKVLDRDDNNELRIKPNFLEKIMSEDGWGITPEFVRQYPALTAGADTDSILYRMA